MAWLEQTNIKGPPGTPGADGAAGPAGPTGPAGQGVPAGGSTGQVLTKTSATDYATNWQTPSGGGGGITDAPSDSVYYTRRNAAWVDGDSVFATDTALTTGLSGKADTSHTHPQSDITNLVTDLAAKAPLASPALTGNPTAPTPTAGDNDTSIATTAFVQTALAGAGTLDINIEPYIWSTVQDNNPSFTEIRMNAAPTSATIIYFSNLDADAHQVSDYQRKVLAAGMLIVFYTSHTDFAVYRVTGAYSTTATATVVPVAFIPNMSGSMMPANGTRILVTFLGGGGGGVTVSDTAPSSPTVGALWWESDSGRLYTYFDSYWVEVGAGSAGVDEVVGGIITIASTAPSAPAVGDVWIDTT